MKIDLFKDYLTFDFLFEQIEELFLSLISGSRKKNHFFVLWVQLSGEGGESENPYLKIRYKIMFFMPKVKVIHSFSTSI